MRTVDVVCAVLYGIAALLMLATLVELLLWERDSRRARGRR